MTDTSSSRCALPAGWRPAPHLVTERMATADEMRASR